MLGAEDPRRRYCKLHSQERDLLSNLAQLHEGIATQFTDLNKAITKPAPEDWRSKPFTGALLPSPKSKAFPKPSSKKTKGTIHAAPPSPPQATSFFGQQPSNQDGKLRVSSTGSKSSVSRIPSIDLSRLSASQHGQTGAVDENRAKTSFGRHPSGV